MTNTKSKLKYLLSFILVFVMAFTCFSLVGCGNNESNNDAKIDLSDKNILVAYFSATGSTEKVAGFIQEILSTDILEIVPTTPYSSADLN